jgi:hypothetical protein
VTRVAIRGLVVLAALALASVGGWVLMDPSRTDPRNIGYVLWKAGVFRAKLEDVSGAMVGDPDRDRLVVGKSRDELRDRFGALLSPADASAYLRGCYESSAWRGKDVVFIDQTSWMVVFEGAKATDLALIKGC